METRTELILLQRTMVVVEGVARTINPDMNMWEGSHNVVEGYIRDSLGPKAMIKDLMDTAKVLSRFGPHLPRLAETALLRASQEELRVKREHRIHWRSVIIGGLAGGVLVYLLP